MQRALRKLPARRPIWTPYSKLAARAIGTRSFASEAPSNPEIYDVVIVGGGPVGLTLAAALGLYYL